MRMLKAASVWFASLAIILAVVVSGHSQTRAPQSKAPSVSEKIHRVVIQVTQDDPAVMNMALNNGENLAKYYQDKGEKIEIEFVAYGAGLNIFRGDTSPVKDRLAEMAGSMKNVTFSGCGNTLAKQSKIENKEISLVPQARVVPTGIARVVELEEGGWSYVRP
jgi:intracellular sulfur oxidation DsrE/DsrF family protein